MSLTDQERERQRLLHRAQLDAIRGAFGSGEEPPALGGGNGGDGERPGGSPPPNGGGEEPELPAGDPLETRLDALTARAILLERRAQHSTRAALVALGAAVLSLGLFWAPTSWLTPRAAEYKDLAAGALSVDHLKVRGAVELVDESGRRLAFLGREPAQVGGPAPVAFGLYGDGGDAQVLRLAASGRGAALSLEAPEGESSLSLVALAGGAQIDLRDGDTTRQLGADPAGAVPAVSGGASATPASGVPDWRPSPGGIPDGVVTNAVDVGDGFLAVDLALAASDAGARLSGRIVNGTALTHNGLAFRAIVDGVTSTFTIGKISSGNSTGFSVVLPGATTAPVTPPRIQYVGSTIGFQSNSMEPRHARLEAH